MQIRVNNTTAHVEGAPEERQWLFEYLTISDESKGFVTTKKARKSKKVVPPKINLYDIAAQTFPSGLIWHVLHKAKIDHVDIEYIDDRSSIATIDSNADLAWLRDYQHEAVLQVLSHGQGIISLPMGVGKGEVAIALPRIIRTNWLFCCHRTGVVSQTLARYTKRFDDKAVQWTRKAPTVARFTGATFQALYRAIGTPEFDELMLRIGGIICDECHSAGAVTVYEVAQHTHNAFYRVGMSATPLDRLDKRSIYAVGAFGPIIVHRPAKEFIENGTLARPVCKWITVEQVITAATTQGRYGKVVVRSQKRNKAIVDIVKRCKKPCLVYIKETKHGLLLRKLIEKYTDFRTDFVYGNTKERTRENVITQLNRNDLDVGIASVVWQDGIDIPNLRAIVNAAAGRSVIAVVQRLGRGSRAMKDKVDFEYWDIWDCGNKLIGQSEARKDALVKYGYDVEDQNQLELF
jgi:superfamily II DNA or RNA helicase